MNRAERAARFVTEIRSWYARHKRSLPWRDLEIADDTERAYRILLSEVMLQQTQVSRVKIVYRNFLQRFPSIMDLAHASNRDVILAWRGMGYNSRALRLRDACRVILEVHEGRFPREIEVLRSIKGIGPYTAAAIRNFAFNLPTPCIDTNIRRILHRTFVGPERPDGTWKKDDASLLVIAAEVLDAALARHFTAAEWHAALMDFGSLVQTKSRPKWDVCPVSACGIMKTTPKNFPSIPRSRLSTLPSTEPGRQIAGRFVPNRIIRGRVVEALRDAPQGMNTEQIGREVCPDWKAEHRQWLDELIKKLVQDRLLSSQGKRFSIAQ